MDESGPIYFQSSSMPFSRTFAFFTWSGRRCYDNLMFSFSTWCEGVFGCWIHGGWRTWMSGPEWLQVRSGEISTELSGNGRGDPSSSSSIFFLCIDRCTDSNTGSRGSDGDYLYPLIFFLLILTSIHMFWWLWLLNYAGHFGEKI